MNISMDDYNEIIAKLEQAYAVSTMLMIDGEEVDGFRSSHRIVSGSLWAVNNLIENIKNDLKKVSKKAAELKVAA